MAALSRPMLAWYSIPLIVAFSLVYGATRHELMSEILQQAIRAGVWITGFMFTIFAVLFVVSRLFL
ncbi:MAG: hypothetical protein FJ297_16365 [Planctomycetes bacterium]|nr:hypothetical protein [Planctomycetota bacterium]